MGSSVVVGGGGGGETSKKKAMWLYPKVMGFTPSERWGHSACYYQGNVYVFGGCCGGLHFSDVLVLNLDTMIWTNMVTTGQGPGPRDSHGALIVGNQMIVFGGTNGSKKVNDLHILDLSTKEWVQPECKGNPPSPRESHTATLVGDDKLVIFGGSGEGESNYLNDLHILDLKFMVWMNIEVRGDIPVPRDSHSATAVGHKLFVYGGDCGDRYQGGVDMLDVHSLTWSKLSVQGSSPGVRAGHAAVNIATKVYILGGVGDRQYYNDAWVLDLCTCSWTQLDTCGQQPQGRFSHTAVVADSDIAIYGGCGEDERPLNDLLVLQLGAEHPNGRYNVSMCKIFGKHWNNQTRNTLREDQSGMKTKLMGNNIELVRKEDHGPKLETKHSTQFMSETLHPKRRRTMNPKLWEVESEQEEHSLSLSQHSSPSQSDQEQTPVRKVSDSVTSSQGLRLLKHVNHSSTSEPHSISRTQPEFRNVVQTAAQQDLSYCGHQNPLKTEQQQLLHVVRPVKEHKSLETGLIQNMIGSEVRGRVDGAFDSGFLMTATVNGKVYRGVLFTPGPGVFSRASIVTESSPLPTNTLPNSNSNHVERSKSLQQRPSVLVPESSGQSFRQAQLISPPPVPIIKPTPSSLPVKLRDDLQGVFLTLGGPGNGSA
ncbi:acyl-CoA-binding domain-containing protein 4 [Cucumis melo var. makuwa]|uniref:Acyl-CoA-binding domain-containing protein 4 n=1 Tax=Cucumis melo var. makuwa TaxID=1194695 RepID=A0A5D3BCW3_CUCMM|nr:acyl-CoA-binding domain-containing protein 4 [Cucumis melo var. makuwa]